MGIVTVGAYGVCPGPCRFVTSRGLSRRRFLQRVSALAATGAVARVLAQTLPSTSASPKVIVGIMGTSAKGRGVQLATALAKVPDVHIAYVCDVDERNVRNAVETVGKHQSNPPQGVGDFRRILDDRSVDAILIAAPDHWHSPAAIRACAAGKHVYVEKPCCHNPHEGQLLVSAARKHKRIVQHGTQRRTWPGNREAIERVQAGEIGRIMSAKCFYFATRKSIGRGKPIDVPAWLDWSLWQGPAPERPFRDNIVPYNWHWFWHWGTGELGNNGVHYIDLARWGLGVDYPNRVTFTGGKYRYPDDDQETPDTGVAAF